MNLFRLPCGIPWGGARRLVLTLACLFALSGLSAQNVTLRFERAKLKTVMDEITRQCDLSFAYSREVVDADRIVSIDLKDAPIDAALQSLFPSGNGIDYAIKNRKILLSAGKQAVRVDSVIKGRVVDDKGQPVVGATVVVVGTTQGTTTGLDGEFSLRVAADDPVLKVDFLGYEPQELRILPSQTTFDITLVPSSKEIDAVVVTALGITRKEKSLGYAVSKVSSEELANTAGGNWLSGMAGKVAGLNLDQSSAGPGGSIRVTLRGEGSLSHDNNSALFVVDGVPINSGMSSNTTSGSYDAVDAPIDYGNGAGDINPDDVESVSVLKGPAATALYGSRAANGAIVITTKSGRKQKGMVLRFRPALRGRNRDFGPISSMNTVPATIVRARWLRICPTASLPTNIRFTPFLPSRATTERKFLRSTRAISSARRSRGSSVTCTVPTTVRRAPTRVCPTKFATGTRDFSIRG